MKYAVQKRIEQFFNNPNIPLDVESSLQDKKSEDDCLTAIDAVLRGLEKSSHLFAVLKQLQDLPK